MSELTTATGLPAGVLPPSDGLAQGELFGEVFFFLGEDDNAHAQKYARHTGTTVERRAWVMQTVCELHVKRFSERDIASICRISRNTVAALVDRARATGKLEPVKKRRAERLDRLMEKQLDQYEQGLDAEEVPAREIPVHFGIFADKRRELEESAEVIAAGPAELDAGALNELIAALPEALPGPTGDSGSGAKEGNGQ